MESNKTNDTLETIPAQRMNNNQRLTKEWDLVKDRYKIDKIIGQGAAGVVVRAKNRCLKTTVAIKYIRAGFKDGQQYTLKRILRELKILRLLTEMKENHHTVKILDIVVSEDMNDIFIVMDYVRRDLSSILKQDSIAFQEENTVTILFRMLCALNFIHKANVMHRDLKPGNILIDDDCNVLLCDFGLARTSPKIEKAKK